MTLLASAAQLASRSAVIRRELAPLAEGLRADLEPVLASLPGIPREKAMLTRYGGRCIVDGSLLTFDPYDPRHVCPVCKREFVGEEHDRFRLYWYQLWLAERTVHAALLGVLTHDEACRDAAMTLLAREADQYLAYPNADNALGPTRPFFSTYLESIWLLNLCVALDFLESGAPTREVHRLGAHVRDRLIEPSADLVASYDEGMSNRQVWNNAALMASARLLGRSRQFDNALHSPSGVEAHLEHALLSDGTWYEGENYHFFAHRGLWYGVQMAQNAGHVFVEHLSARMHEGFAAPFRSVLPDFTFPSRRDSQYAISVRQPRFAESCELGLASRDDRRLVAMLACLYDPSIPRGVSTRWASSADVDRNQPATGLNRSDLSWRSLLAARGALPPLVMLPGESDLLPAQGLAILRRDDASVYTSLDYGHSGGGHGHPDRLNLTFADGERRWFDDPGTGSYTDPSLAWYRSTLAHNAPLVDGHEQDRVHGRLRAWSDDGQAGWVSAEAELSADCTVRRTVVTMADYLVDVVEWSAPVPRELTLPVHRVVPDGRRTRPSSAFAERSAPDPGYAFLGDITRVAVPSGRIIAFHGEHDAAAFRGWMAVPEGTVLLAATAPSPPGIVGRSAVALVRVTSAKGVIISVWTWADAVRSIERSGDELTVHRNDGTQHVHHAVADGWSVDVIGDDGSMRILLSGLVDEAPTTKAPPEVSSRPAALSVPTELELGEPHYRMSEVSWTDAGSPVASVRISRSGSQLRVSVDVQASERLFVPLATENALDNEPAAINGDGIQLYVVAGAGSAGKLLVPEGTSVGMRSVDGWSNDLPLTASWYPTPGGYRIDAEVTIDPALHEVELDVIVNETTAGRARRRGQLVLSGGRGEHVYLRGDRHDPSRLLRFTIAND